MRPIFHHLFLALALAGPASAQSTNALFEVSVDKFMMGTSVEMVARHAEVSHCRKAVYLACREMERVEHLLSSFEPESEISRINRAAGIQPVKVSPETFAIVQRSKSYADRTDALVDISIGPLTELWGFSSDNPARVLPRREEIEARRERVDYRRVLLDSLNTTVFLSALGCSLDLGGLKGYAVDRGASILKQQGIRDFIIKAGGDIYVSGRKDADTDWQVGIRHPREMNALIARFRLKDFAVSTSGDYERYTIIDGRRYHHILDPRTGYPSQLSQSSTVLCSTSEEADVLAKYAFILGYEEALKNKKLTIPFLIVSSDGSIHYNNAFSGISGLEILGKD